MNRSKLIKYSLILSSIFGVASCTEGSNSNNTISQSINSQSNSINKNLGKDNSKSFNRRALRTKDDQSALRSLAVGYGGYASTAGDNGKICFFVPQHTDFGCAQIPKSNIMFYGAATNPNNGTTVFIGQDYGQDNEPLIQVVYTNDDSRVSNGFGASPVYATSGMSQLVQNYYNVDMLTYLDTTGFVTIGRPADFDPVYTLYLSYSSDGISWGGQQFITESPSRSNYPSEINGIAQDALGNAVAVGQLNTSSTGVIYYSNFSTLWNSNPTWKQLLITESGVLRDVVRETKRGTRDDDNFDNFIAVGDNGMLYYIGVRPDSLKVWGTDILDNKSHINLNAVAVNNPNDDPYLFTTVAVGDSGTIMYADGLDQEWHHSISEIGLANSDLLDVKAIHDASGGHYVAVSDDGKIVNIVLKPNPNNTYTTKRVKKIKEVKNEKK